MAPHADWHRLAQLHDSIQSFHVPLPLIHVHNECLPGLSSLRQQLKNDCEALEKAVLRSTQTGVHANSSHAALSTNAPYLIAVSDELLSARRPVAIYRTFSLAAIADRQHNARRKGMTPQERKALKRQIRAVKVDVVAEGGASWVRVNTIKNSRLMMEFREIDSYLTSDEEQGAQRPRLPQTEFDNSVLRMGRELLVAAAANPISVPISFSSFVSDSSLTPPCPGPSAATITPKVTIRLTRLDPHLKDGTDADPDPRIEMTIQRLREMGIDVQLGERAHPHSALIPKRPAELRMPEPTTNCNLDLSALIALISDVSHSPLPRTEEDARARFVQSQSYLDWKKDRAMSLARQCHSLYYSTNVVGGEGDEGTREDSGQCSRALAAQAIQEMSKGVLQEVHERLSAVLKSPSIPSTTVRFWTTSEARRRCLQIVSKVGGQRERQRACALLGSTICARIPPVPAAALRRSNGVTDTGGEVTPTAATPGMHDVEGPCSKTSVDAYWEHSRYPAAFLPLVPVHVYPSILPLVEEDEGMQSRTTPLSPFFNALTLTCTGILSHAVGPGSVVSQGSASDPSPTTEEAPEEMPPCAPTSLPKLTMHTVASMLAGAARGYTTLTTNRSSVKTVLKEMRTICGSRGEGVEKAALWMLDPRSLADG